jgi:hemerythrin-like domain-containing protein
MPKNPLRASRATRLREDHVELDRRFDDLCERARVGDWHELDEVWKSFAADLEAHMAFEEEALFPAFGQGGIECRDLVKQLVGEHAAIRQLLEQIGIDIQLHTIRASTIELFTDLMREHAALENSRFYPWAELEGRAWAATTNRATRSRDRLS